MAWIIWLAAFVILIGIEAATMALTTIWFAGGAIIAFYWLYSGQIIMFRWRHFYYFLCAAFLYPALCAEIRQ